VVSKCRSEPTTNYLLCLCLADRPDIEQDRTRGRGQRAGDDVEQRRLAGAVGSYEREDGAARHLQAHVVEGPEPAEVPREVPDGEDRRVAHGAGAGRRTARGRSHPLTLRTSASSTSPRGRKSMVRMMSAP